MLPGEDGSYSGWPDASAVAKSKPDADHYWVTAKGRGLAVLWASKSVADDHVPNRSARARELLGVFTHDAASPPEPNVTAGCAVTGRGGHRLFGKFKAESPGGTARCSREDEPMRRSPAGGVAGTESAG